MKLRTKFSLITGVLVIALLAVTAGVLFVFEKRGLINEIRARQEIMVKNLAKVSRDCYLRKDNIFLINYLKTIKKNDDSVSYALFADSRNKVLAHTRPEMIRENLTDDFSKKAVKSEFMMVHTRANLPGGRVIEYAMPVKLANENIGAAMAGFSESAVNRNISSAMNRIRKRILAAGVVSLVIALVAIFLVSNSIVRPVRMLTRGAELIGEGKLDTRIDLKTGDEFALLADKFNEMSEKLKELDEMKRDFTSSVTHELRSPLGAIETYINKMLDGGLSGFMKSGIADLGVMKNNAVRLSRFIDDLLDTAKIESGRMEISSGFFALEDAARDVAELFAPSATEKGVNISVEIPDNLPQAWGDKERIRQVLINLAGNALKFTPAGGRIVISAQMPPAGKNFIKFSVCDTGAGIPAEDLKYIFDKFRQVKGGAKSVKGTGLGLFIVRNIMEIHGGTVEVSSKPGKGTEFVMTLPLKNQ